VRIGVVGGSFDPVHRGHLSVARQLKERLHLDEIRFVPARSQPLKTAGHHAGPEHRLAMLQAAIAHAPGFQVDRREIDRTGPSYTIDTLRELKLEHPSDELFLLIGADAARDLPRWRDGSELGRLATLVVVPRTGAPLPVLPPGAMQVDLDPVELSATDVRRAAAGGASLGNMVPAGVAAYIAAHRLYQRESDA
jgi:nicotinate-nucleotide adenylyltransferase